MRKRTQAREAALQLLYQHEMNPSSLEEIFASFRERQPDFPPETTAFTEGLVRGALERLADIDAVIGKYTENWDLARMAVLDRNILRLATYELLFVQDVPPKVTINEAVNMAKKFSQGDSGKFVNGVLDKITHTEKPRVDKLMDLNG